MEATAPGPAPASGPTPTTASAAAFWVVGGEAGPVVESEDRGAIPKIFR